MSDPEKIVVFNGYGTFNKTPKKLATWVKDMGVDVAIVSELFKLQDELSQVGKVYTGNTSVGSKDCGIVLFGNARADEHNVVQLTKNTPWHKEHPGLSHDRWYVRVRVGKRVYYSVHANAVISQDGQWLSNPGANVWRQDGIPKLKEAVKKDIQAGYAVRVGGDFNFGHSTNPPNKSPQNLFADLGLDFMWDRVIWLAWDPRYDKVLKKYELGLAPGADAHKTLRLNLEQKRQAPGTPGPPPGRPTEEGGTKSDKIRIVTANLKRTVTFALAKADILKIVAEWDPDIIGLQEMSDRLGLARKIPGYGLAVPKNAKPAEVDNPILFKTDKFRMVGANAIKLPVDANSPQRPRYLNMAHLKHLQFNTSIYVFNTQFYQGVDDGGLPGSEVNKSAINTVRKHLNLIADQATDRAKGENLVFWMGDFDIDEDADNQKDYKGFPNRIFHDKGLLSIYDELKTGADFDTKGRRKVDIIGTHTLDDRVKATKVLRMKLNSDHYYVLGEFRLTTTERAPQAEDYGTPTSAAYDPDPTTPTLPYQRDTGPSGDHSYCCEGRSFE